MSHHKRHLFTALALLACPGKALGADVADTTVTEIPSSLQDEMEVLIETFANKSIFLDAADDSAPRVLPLAEWQGIEFYKRKKHHIKCIRWNDNHFGGSINFSKLPRFLFSLFIESNELHGSLKASSLPHALQIIMARNNHLSGTIAWDKLPKKLTVLGIENNAFTGEVNLDQVPDCLASLKIEGNQFSNVKGTGGKRLVVSGRVKEVPKPQRRVDRVVHSVSHPQPSVAREDVFVQPSTVQTSASPHHSQESTQHTDEAVYLELPSTADRKAHRELFPSFDGSDAFHEQSVSKEEFTSDYSSMYGTETFDSTFDTESSLSAIHLPLSQSTSEHRDYQDDVFQTYYDTTTMDHTSENFLSANCRFSVDSGCISPIHPHSENSEFGIPAVDGEPVQTFATIGGSAVRSIVDLFRLIMSAFVKMMDRIFRLIVMPISQPYPSSACFANY